MMGRAHSLQRRMVAAFALFSMISALCFGALGVLFLYTVEDSFFARLLDQEAAHQRQAWQRDGRLAAPLRPFVTLHHGQAGFPADLARRLAAGARGTEVPGDAGRHYHLRHLQLDGAGPLVLVAEVGAELVVRPRLPFILAFLGLSALALLAASLGAGYWLARRASAPLRRLAGLVAQSAPERLPRGFASTFPDNEIGLLAQALDDALARIAGFIEREQHFTRDASHELRTPLAVIDGAAALLAQQALPERGAAQLARIRSAAAHMTQTVETLLSLAREETAAPAPAPCPPLALLPLIEAAVVQFAHLLDGKAVEVLVEVAPHETARVPGPVLAILLSNLVSNAFSHTHQGSIRIAREGAVLVVADSGPGIDPALRASIYESGVKGEHSSGFGLGLSIARRLGERFGIGLEIVSGAGGTRALLRLP
ncbi:sensor histidine kinase [Massilia aquatica]|uniref:histidine kinase n=1 Tax=Massilia aquatica TaxID=2609000 RepID=A0ABX0MCN9_9BURK|nr:HAMP domain-containing sensor histidine kinase [Massilia aquatica]NHZ42180.1 HAMP domain-containing histidine kinase [Massilia aquatica]